MNDNNITDKILLDNQFVLYKDEYFDEYRINIEDKWYIDVKKASNYKGRDWTVGIDNCDRDTVAVVDIQTIDQFNKVIEIMEINFKLKTK